MLQHPVDLICTLRSYGNCLPDNIPQMANVTYWSSYSLFIVVSWLQAGFLSRQEHNHLVSCDAAVCIPAITGSKPFCLLTKKIVVYLQVVPAYFRGCWSI